MTDPGAFDARQRRVFEALLKRSSKLAGMYSVVLGTLAVPASPGSEVARVSVLCHCCRELMNGVPSVMSEVDIRRPNPNSDALKRQLAELLADADLSLEQDLVLR
jgi:hypothetical protein